MSQVSYKRENGSTVIGTVIGYDGGDYGFNEVVNIQTPNDEIVYSCPVNKVKEVTESEYLDLRGLIYGF